MGGVHVGLDFGGEPFAILLAEEGGDEAQKGGLVGEKSGDAGAAFEFLIDAPDGVAGAHAPLRGGGEDVNGKPSGGSCSIQAASFGADLA